MYLGQDVATGEFVGFQHDGHLLTIGPTRSGKSRRLLIPNLLAETGRSALVIDVKGELCQFTAAHRAARGGRVVALDPFGLLAEKGISVPLAGFNPLAALDPESDDFVDDAMTIAEALVEVNPQAKDPHWSESAQDVVCALVMWARTVRGPSASLRDVRYLICQPATGLEVVAVAAERMKAHPAIAGKLAKFRNIPEKGSSELSSVLSTAQTQTRFLDSPGIVHNLEQGGVDFADLKRENMTCYLVIPPARLKSHAKWLRLVVAEAMRAMQVTHIKPKYDVLFLLDEFPALGKMESVETAVSLNAGYGVKVWAAVQNVGQLEDIYGKNWETFVSAGCLTAFAPRDAKTRDYLSNLIGKGSKVITNTSYDQQGRATVSHNLQKDEIMNPHQWREMRMGEILALIPTPEGQFWRRLLNKDFTELPGFQAA